MKNFTRLSTAIAVILLFAVGSIQAQIKSPQPSPGCTITQSIGLTQFTVDYSRPGVKDRVIFGELLPYGKVWRTGANMNTTIAFDTDVKLAGNEIAAGKYALLTVPGESEWTIILNKKAEGNIGTYDEAEDLIRFQVASKNDVEPKLESFTIEFGNLRNESAALILAWENTVVSVPIEVEVAELVMASIESTMKGPGSGDYYRAANYYYDTDHELEQALEWAGKSLEMRPTAFWIATLKARILGKLGRTKEAIEASEAAIEIATEAENDDYVKINTDLIAGWK